MITKFIRFCLKITPLAALVLIILQFAVANELAGSGRLVQNADLTINKLREENDELRQQVASASALATISFKAREAGFTQTPNYIMIGPAEVALSKLR